MPKASYKVEKISLKVRRRQSAKIYDLLSALRCLKVGESFLADITSTDRMVLSIAGFLLDRQFVTDQKCVERSKGTKCRVGRTK